ncbi:MAG: NGG1p interacting factor NIF3, partial [Patescibacteria group bacterium]|nr:NGG1p interacting factor NIF3 [Patescibacteria group bacterium]
MMTINQIYQLAISEGIRHDLRGQSRVRELLKRANEKYKKLAEAQKELFDEESLTNPYSDTRVFHGDAAARIKKVMVGVDIDTGEVMLANELNRRDPEHPIDL